MPNEIVFQSAGTQERLVDPAEMERAIQEIKSGCSYGPGQRHKYDVGYCQVAALSAAIVIMSMQVVALEALQPIIPFALLATVVWSNLIGRRKCKTVFNSKTWHEHLSMLIDYYEPLDRSEWNNLLDRRDAAGNIPLEQLSEFLKLERLRAVGAYK